MGACALVLAVEDSIRQSRGGGGAMCAQMNIFERVVRIVKVIISAFYDFKVCVEIVCISLFPILWLDFLFQSGITIVA